MFALINASSPTPTVLGRCESVHRTRSAAEKADTALQKAVRERNGSGSFLPTRIAEVKRSVKVGQWVSLSDLAEDGPGNPGKSSDGPRRAHTLTLGETAWNRLQAEARRRQVSVSDLVEELGMGLPE